ncbi:hypothetical protein L228DRAFT_3495 [Xylona heveae TC161]|uniref:Uncharacterized protein n=1 Tax=Xylona heveae (strain CBS 132557 / TC161) TaxID=1328760 RepID=A0A165JC21_XYLHT|nr:hypothetical protein L228DRAFT_3495 [Xylona heveae TC161]KZF26034.1 hypothetical protein L228DRAFT_3495 [Xylona heveae TC161]
MDRWSFLPFFSFHLLFLCSLFFFFPVRRCFMSAFFCLSDTFLGWCQKKLLDDQKEAPRSLPNQLWELRKCDTIPTPLFYTSGLTPVHSFNESSCCLRLYLLVCLFRLSHIFSCFISSLYFTLFMGPFLRSLSIFVVHFIGCNKKGIRA